MKGFRKQYDQLRERAAKYWSQLQKKGLEHWLRVAILTVLGLLIGQWIGRAEIWQDLRYKIYQSQTSRFSVGQPAEWRTVFVLIDDDEYWKGEPARRVPIKRDYLAKLLRVVDRADPALVALDFDLRSPVPSGELIEHPDYQCERQKLLKAIVATALHRPVIIPRQVALVGENTYVEQSDIFRGFDFSSVKGNLFPGYIQLAQDLRIIPPRLRIAAEPDGVLDSFSLAMLHADNSDMYQQIVAKQSTGDEVNLRFGTFLDAEKFEKLSFASSKVLAGDADTLARLAHKLVIIGGKWHQDALGSGEWNDEHLTPAGHIIGAYVQGSYAEALRRGKWYPAWSELWVVVFEILVVFGAAAFLAFDIRPGWKVGAAVVPSLVIMLLSYFLLQNIGLFFDFFVPLVIISLHALAEHLEWRS